MPYRIINNLLEDVYLPGNLKVPGRASVISVRNLVPPNWVIVEFPPVEAFWFAAYGYFTIIYEPYGQDERIPITPQQVASLDNPTPELHILTGLRLGALLLCYTLDPLTKASRFALYAWNPNSTETPSPPNVVLGLEGNWVLVSGAGGSGQAVQVADLTDPTPELHTLDAPSSGSLLVAYDIAPLTYISRFAIYAWNPDSTETPDPPAIVMGLGGNWVKTGGGGTAVETSYDDSESGLGPNVQVALDTLALLLPHPAWLEDLNYLGTFHQGYISAGQTLVHFSAGDFTTLITSDTSLDAECMSDEFNKADKGVLELQEYDGLAWVTRDSFDLEDAFDEAYRSVHQGATYNHGAGLPCLSTGGGIELMAVGIFATIPVVQKGTVRVHLPLTGGDIRPWRLMHSVGSHTADITPVFRDLVAGVPVASPYVITPLSVTLSYLSGIRYLGLGTSFTMAFSVTNLFDNSYKLPLITIDHFVSVPDQSLGLADVSGISSPPAIGETATVSRALTMTIANVKSSDLQPRVIPHGVFGDGTPQVWSGPKILLNTYGHYATALREYFVDENYRLPYDAINDFNVPPSPVTGQWDSTEVIVNRPPGPFDPYKDVLHVFNGELKYPQDNFTSGYVPSQDPLADFTGAIGSKSYIRAFVHTHGDAYANGLLTLTGITLADLEAGDILVLIKLPSQTAWLSLNDPYIFGAFDPDIDFMGCRTSASGSTFGWTSETRYTNLAGDMIVVALAFSDTPAGRALRLTYMENQFA